MSRSKRRRRLPQAGFTMRIRRVFRFWPALVVVPAALVVYALWPARYTYTVSPETTYVTEPLDARGFVDYQAAVNDRLATGVTPETNANVLIFQALGPHPEGGTMPPEYFRRLGIPQPPEAGEYFVGWDKYFQAHLKDPPDDVLGFAGDEREWKEQWTARSDRARRVALAGERRAGGRRLAEGQREAAGADGRGRPAAAVLQPARLHVHRPAIGPADQCPLAERAKVPRGRHCPGVSGDGPNRRGGLRRGLAGPARLPAARPGPGRRRDAHRGPGRDRPRQHRHERARSPFWVTGLTRRPSCGPGWPTCGPCRPCRRWPTRWP